MFFILYLSVMFGENMQQIDALLLKSSNQLITSSNSFLYQCSLQQYVCIMYVCVYKSEHLIWTQYNYLFHPMIIYWPQTAEWKLVNYFGNINTHPPDEWHHAYQHTRVFWPVESLTYALPPPQILTVPTTTVAILHSHTLVRTWAHTDTRFS